MLMSDQHEDEERRESERRWVMMRVVVESRNRVFMTQTLNVSESGILVERVPDLQLLPGQQISVVVEGVLENPDEGASRRLLEVVRVASDGVALRFVD
jgi:hypothetical protein